MSVSELCDGIATSQLLWTGPAARVSATCVRVDDPVGVACAQVSSNVNLCLAVIGEQPLSCGTQKKKKEKRKSQHVPPSDVIARKKLLATFLRWLFQDYIVPLLRSHFYVTERESSGFSVFYYRKVVSSSSNSHFNYVHSNTPTSTLVTSTH